jgi:hypothetical protein
MFALPTTRATAENQSLTRLQALQLARQQERQQDPLTSVLRNAFAPRDTATISQAAKDRVAAESNKQADPSQSSERAPTIDPTDDPELSDSQERAVKELATRDREVRAHEQAHKAAAGNLATSGASYSYQTGPDGKRYAIGGEVQIRLQTGSTPEETIRQMERVTQAANAPESPSGPDRAVAGQAARILANARKQLASQGTGAQSVRGSQVDLFA